MSWFWGLSINNDERVKCALNPYVDDVSFQTGDTGAWGLTYYSRGELLQRVEPKQKGEPLDVKKVAHGIRADLLLMHTRAATVGQIRPENIHPFRFKEWTFAHNGTIKGFDNIKTKMCNAMPPFILRSLGGDTDSEHVFGLFLSFLYDAGLVGRSDLGIVPIRDALSRAVAMTDEFSREAGETASPGSFIVSDGYSLVILNHGIPVDYFLIESIRECRICRSSVEPNAEKHSGIVAHDDLRAVLVRSGPLEKASGFQALETDSFLMVTKNHNIEFSPFS